MTGSNSTSHISQQMTHDVLIVGGGPVGLVLALTLVRFCPDVSVAVLDRRPFAPPEDGRASAVAAGVRRALETLGVWGDMASASQPVSAMKITDSGSGDIARPVFLRFSGEVAPGEVFAHMVPNIVMSKVLLAALEGRVSLLGQADISAFSADGAAGTLRLADGQVLAAPLVVAADGARSMLRSSAGIGVVAHDYHQSGIVTTIGHALDHGGVAYEHFRPAGPFASLPLPGRRSSLVWAENPADAARYKVMPPDELAVIIEEVMGSSLGAVQVLDRVQTFPLHLQIAREMIASRLALIGDAAHVIHPIAGQGLNLGLKDVAALAEVVIEAMRLGLDHGAPDVLERYQRWRRLDTTLMAFVTDGMNRLFSNDMAPVRALRDFGLGMVDRLPPVKDFLIGRAAGVDRGGPKLLSGHPI